MWKNTPDPWELRQMFPEEARLLEDYFLLTELRSLEVVFTKSRLKKATIFKVALSDSYELWISPVDIGPRGQTEWFTWHKPHNHNSPHQPNSKAPEYQMSIRACIQLVKKDQKKIIVRHSFTNAQETIEDLLRSSLMCIHRDIGLQLLPIIKPTQQRSTQNRE
jgi:hypothetical protein